MSPTADEWTEVARVSHMEAEILRLALETAGIPVQTFGEAVAELYAVTATELGDVQVLVPTDRADEARELLSDSHPVDFPEGD